jgi:hypothetical protein
MILILFNGSIVDRKVSLKESKTHTPHGPGIAPILRDETNGKVNRAFNNNLSSLRQAIFAETKVFLSGLKSGASDEQLQSIVHRIREKEHRLAQEEGAVLDPIMWRILHSRLMARKVQFIDLNT